jgi:hypothetical protein
MLSDPLTKADVISLVSAAEPVEIVMKDRDPTGILIAEREARTADREARGKIEPSDKALGPGGLPGTQRTRKGDDITRAAEASDGFSEGEGRIGAHQERGQARHRSERGSG